MQFRFFITLLVSIIILSRQSDGKAGWQELNLMRYNIPVSIMAPDSAEVKTAEVSGVMRDVTIEDNENDFLVQIFSGQGCQRNPLGCSDRFEIALR